MKKIETKTLLKIAVIAFIFYLCVHYWPSVAVIFKTAFAAVLPLLIGAAVAYPLDILVSFFERHLLSKSENKFIVKTRRGLAVTLSLISLVSIVALIIALVVPQLTKCVKMLIDEIPDALTFIVAQLDKFEFVPDDIIGFLSGIDWQSKISSIITTVTSGVGSVMNVVISTVSTVVSGVTTTVLAVIFAIKHFI